MTFRFVPEAQADLDEAIQWYRGRDPEVAAEFFQAVTDAITRAMSHPLIYRLREKQYRCCNIETFPYLLIFRLQQDHIEIYAVAHHSRKPGYWKDRIS